ncbi:hypothetical protein QQF64_009376 [Cirrhinus molitorella]|uniref:Uncharacterized protein n=1 Tax=Cirrhinus molitorella TaxID=172907 RepID=A0ABR3M0Z9_9TELE
MEAYRLEELDITVACQLNKKTIISVAGSALGNNGPEVAVDGKREEREKTGMINGWWPGQSCGAQTLPPYTEGATFVQGSPSQLCSERRDGARSNLQFSTSAVRGRWSQARASVKRAVVRLRASVRDRPPPMRETAGADQNVLAGTHFPQQETDESNWTGSRHRWFEGDLRYRCGRVCSRLRTPYRESPF